MKGFLRQLIIIVLAGFLGAGIYALRTNVQAHRPLRLDVTPGGGSYEKQLATRKFDLIMGLLETNYVDTVNFKEVGEEAIVAALKKLDPHSVYFPPQDLKEANESLGESFEGIGITFNVPNDTAIVISVIPGGPSSKVGILPGDKLLAADTVTVSGVKMRQDDMVRHFKGPKGSTVCLKVLRGSELLYFDVVRDKIPLHSIDCAFMLSENVGYIRLSKFSRTTHKEFVEACMNLVAKGMTSLVFDLRGNTGGYLDQAWLLGNELLEKGDTVVYCEGLHSPKQVYAAYGNGNFKTLPLKVLIDEETASAAEIIAGAIQDNDRGTIIGRRSYGKGLVQEPFDFTDGSGVRLTIAKYYTPSGRCIQKPYADYEYDFMKRYEKGEFWDEASVSLDTTQLFYTKGGRKVYGGGGIAPDVFVAMDTTKISPFHLAVNKKSLVMRYSAKYFQEHRADILEMSTMAQFDAYFSRATLAEDFVKYAASQGVKMKSAADRESLQKYIMPQLKGLIARYSSDLGEEAFYRYVLPIEPIYQYIR